MTLVYKKSGPLDILQLLPTKGCTHFTTIFTSPIIQPCRYHDLPFQTISTPHEILGCRSADRLGGVATREKLTRKTKVMALSTSEFMALQAEFNNFVLISNPLKLRKTNPSNSETLGLFNPFPLVLQGIPRRHWLGILHFAGRLGRRRNGAGERCVLLGAIAWEVIWRVGEVGLGLVTRGEFTIWFNMVL